MQETIQKKLKEANDTILEGELQVKYLEWLKDNEEDQEKKDKLTKTAFESNQQHEKNVVQLELFTKFLKEQLED